MDPRSDAEARLAEAYITEHARWISGDVSLIAPATRSFLEHLARIAIDQAVVAVWRASWCIVCQGTAKELDGSGPCHGCDGTGLNPIPWSAVCAGTPDPDQPVWDYLDGKKA